MVHRVLPGTPVLATLGALLGHTVAALADELLEWAVASAVGAFVVRHCFNPFQVEPDKS